MKKTCIALFFIFACVFTGYADSASRNQFNGVWRHEGCDARHIATAIVNKLDLLISIKRGIFAAPLFD